MTRRSLLWSAAAALGVPFLWSCSQFADSTPCTTAKPLTAAQLRALFPGRNVLCGDATYAETVDGVRYSLKTSERKAFSVDATTYRTLRRSDKEMR